MAMVDLLCQVKEMALLATNPHLMTVATLTGHAIIAMGDKYTIIMENGPAKKRKMAAHVQARRIRVWCGVSKRVEVGRS
jgi:leucyl aminopeptidase